MCHPARTPQRTPQRPQEDTGEAATRDTGDSSRSHPQQVSSSVPRPRREASIQSQDLALDLCYRSVDLQQNSKTTPRRTNAVDNEKREGETHLLGSDASSQPSRLAHQQQNITLPASDVDANRGKPAEILEYDHSWVEHYPPPPRIRTRTQSQEGFLTEERHVNCEDYLSLVAGMPRVSSLPSLLRAVNIRDECHIRPAMGLLGSREQTGSSSRGTNGTYSGNTPQPNTDYENTSEQAAARRMVDNSPKKQVDGDMLATAQHMSWADIVEEEEEDEKIAYSSGAGSEPWRFDQSCGIATGAYLAMRTTGPLQPTSDRNGSRFPRRAQENTEWNDEATVSSKEKLAGGNRSPQDGNRCGGLQHIKEALSADREERSAALIGQVGSLRTTHQNGHLNPVGLEPPTAAATALRRTFQQISSPDVRGEKKPRMIIRGISVDSNILQDGPGHRVPLESSLFTPQSMPAVTEPFPSFDDSHFVELQDVEGAMGVKTDLVMVPVSLDDSRDETGHIQPLLPHKRLSAPPGSSEKCFVQNGPQLRRTPPCVESPTVGKSQGFASSVAGNGYSPGAPSGSNECKSPMSPDQEHLEISTNSHHVSNGSREAIGSAKASCSKGKHPGPPESDDFPCLVSSSSSSPNIPKLAISWSKLHMTSKRDNPRGGGNQIVNPCDYHKKETTLIQDSRYKEIGGSGTPRDANVDPLDKTTVRCSRAGAYTKAEENSMSQALANDALANTSESLANPAAQTDVSPTAQQKPSQNTGSLFSGSEAPVSDKALPRWVPQRTVVPMAPANCKKNWLERLGQESEYKAVVSLETPGFDLSAMSFAERVRAPKSRDPLPSAWIESSPETGLEIAVVEPTAILRAISRATPLKKSLSSADEVGSPAEQQRSQHPSRSAAVASKRRDLVITPTTPSGTDEEKVKEKNSPPRVDKARRWAGKQVVQMPEQHSPSDNNTADRRVAPEISAPNRAGREKTIVNTDKRDQIKTAVAIPHIDFLQPSFNRTARAKRAVPKALQSAGAAVSQIKVSQDSKHNIEKKDEGVEERQRRSRTVTMIPQPITPGGTLRSERGMTIDVGVASPLKTYKLKAKTPEWDLSSSTSSLATFITAPESPIQPWSPNQEYWPNKSPITPYFTSLDMLGDGSPTVSTSSGATDRIVPPSEADDTIVTTALADSPASVLTEKAGGEYMTAKAQVGNTELSTEFLLRLVSELPPESYEDIYQKYPAEIESLLQLRRASQSPRVDTSSSSRTDASEGYLADSGYEAVLADARRGRRRAVSPQRGQQGNDHEQTRLLENWLEPSGQIIGVSKTETGGHRQGAGVVDHEQDDERDRDQVHEQDRYIGRSEQAGILETSTINCPFNANSLNRSRGREPTNSISTIISDPAIIAQGQIVNNSRGRGKPTKRAQRKKYNRPGAIDRHTPAQSPQETNSEQAFFADFPQLVSDFSHDELAAKAYFAAQASPVPPAISVYRRSALGTPHIQLHPEVPMADPYNKKSASLHGGPAYYNLAHFPPVQPTACFPNLAIQNNSVASPTIQPARPDNPPPTNWIDYHGKTHSPLPPDQADQASPARHMHVQHSLPQAHARQTPTDNLRSPERSPSRGDRVLGRSVISPSRMSLGLSDASKQRERALLAPWVDQDSELPESQNRMAEGDKLLKIEITKPHKDKPHIAKFGAMTQEEGPLANEGIASSSAESANLNPLGVGLDQWNTQLEKPEAIEGTLPTTGGTIIGFLPCRKCEVTSAIEDFILKCPKCDPDFQHKYDL
ncbi:hypothetical protein FGG08_004441 [Glutinoglossum americanum]|uniref:Uncharacterized protein n=1 Tax=Glutinoglossum americanum TaxID=1670608 RepID=A0A9P8I5A9_9PEZI|nr:hypothetical protein FGG08_004441 [Glutinoglossum americanum]